VTKQQVHTLFEFLDPEKRGVISAYGLRSRLNAMMPGFAPRDVNHLLNGKKEITEAELIALLLDNEITTDVVANVFESISIAVMPGDLLSPVPNPASSAAHMSSHSSAAHMSTHSVASSVASSTSTHGKLAPSISISRLASSGPSSSMLNRTNSMASVTSSVGRTNSNHFTIDPQRKLDIGKLKGMFHELGLGSLTEEEVEILGRVCMNEKMF
jgi:hypothetical protein